MSEVTRAADAGGAALAGAGEPAAMAEGAKALKRRPTPTSTLALQSQSDASGSDSDGSWLSARGDAAGEGEGEGEGAGDAAAAGASGAKDGELAEASGQGAAPPSDGRLGEGEGEDDAELVAIERERREQRAAAAGGAGGRGGAHGRGVGRQGLGGAEVQDGEEGGCDGDSSASSDDSSDDDGAGVREVRAPSSVARRAAPLVLSRSGGSVRGAASVRKRSRAHNSAAAAAYAHGGGAEAPPCDAQHADADGPQPAVHAFDVAAQQLLREEEAERLRRDGEQRRNQQRHQQRDAELPRMPQIPAVPARERQLSCSQEQQRQVQMQLNAQIRVPGEGGGYAQDQHQHGQHGQHHQHHQHGQHHQHQGMVDAEHARMCFARSASDRMLGDFMNSWRADNASGAWDVNEMAKSVSRRSSAGSSGGPADVAGLVATSLHLSADPVAWDCSQWETSVYSKDVTAGKGRCAPGAFLASSKLSPSMLEPMDTSKGAIEARLKALTAECDFAYAIYWRTAEAARAARAAVTAVSTSDRHMAARAAETAVRASGPGVLVTGGMATRTFAGCDADLYTEMATHLQGFSLGLGIIGRTAWTGRPEWWTDVRTAPPSVYHRRELAIQTGIAMVAVVPSGCGVVEVGAPTVRQEEPAVVRRIADCMRGL